MLETHPYADVIRKLEGARAVAPYKEIRYELLDELADGIVKTQLDEAKVRLTELFGKEKVVVPTGSEVEMLGDRFNVFLDGEGNPVPNSEIWQAVMENYPQLWSENEKYASHMPVGMPGVDGYDALARALGIKPRVFANYAVDESGKAAFIEDYDRYKKIIRSRKATGTEKTAAERWMHENVSSKKADWRCTMFRATLSSVSLRISRLRSSQRASCNWVRSGACSAPRVR